MSTFLGWSSALIAAGATTTSMQSTFASVMSSTGANPWQISRQSALGTVWNTGGTPATNPGNAMDMTSNTYASGTVPVYVGIYRSAGFTPTVMYVQSDTSSFATAAPLTFTLDYSSNGSSWTTLQSFSGQNNWTSCERRKYTITGATSQNYWRINVTAVQSASTLQLGEWTLEDVNNNWLTTKNFFDCIPPTTETIGNSYARDELRWFFFSSSITIGPVQTALSPWPQLFSWDTATAGAATLSITINSNTVSFVGSTGNTLYQNARGLYEACKESANSNFTAMNWLWNTNVLGDVGTGIFYASQVTPATNMAITSSNITTRVRGTSVPNVPLVQGSQISNSQSITIDLTNGWIYYLQICSRGIALGSKTNTTYYGVLHACYGDSASSLAQLPTSELAVLGLPCTPIELFVGVEVSGESYSTLYPTHWWGAQNAWNSQTDNLPFLIDVNFVSAHPIAHFQIPGFIQDFAQNAVISSGLSAALTPYIGLVEGYQGTGTGNYNTYNIHRVSVVPVNAVTVYSVQSSTNVLIFYSNPSYANLDWYRYIGTAPNNEQLLISPSLDFTTTISTTGLSTDTTLNVASTSGFPTSGWLALEGEIISYGGTTSTSFTSCVRGKFSTQTVSPIAGTTIYIAGWFCYMNNGLIFGGYQQPT